MSEPTQQEQEKTPQEERLIPKEIIRPLARGLLQAFSPLIEEIRTQISPAELEENANFQKAIQDMNPSLGKIETLLQKLQTVREIRLAPEEEIIFSEESEDEVPSEGHIIVDKKMMDAKLMQDLLSALSHHISHPLAQVIGYSELMRDRSKSDEIRTRMTRINQSGRKITEYFDPIRTATKLEITTDKAGSTKIIPSNENLVG